MGRRTKKVVHKNSDLAENKLRVKLRKVGCTPMDGIQEVNFFPTNDELYHFEKCEGRRVWMDLRLSSHKSQRKCDCCLR